MDITKILLVEDNKPLRHLVKDHLSKNGYIVFQAPDIETANYHFENERINLIILDLMLNDKDGMEFLQTVRKTNQHVPVIIISTIVSIKKKLKGFNLGADDYVTKPFYPEELVSRVKRMIERARQTVPAQHLKPDKPTVIGHFSINYKNGTISKNGQVLGLRRKLWRLLEYVILNNNRIIDKAQLYTYAWGDDSMYNQNTLNVHIQKLRSKIEDNPAYPMYLKTIHGQGIKFFPTGKE
ncbi:MAG: response regulator transcription factor [Spirochaetia bacterium]